jgi:hypothetical protein
MKNTRALKLLGLSVLIISSTMGCSGTQPKQESIRDYGFFVKGVTGKQVMLDRTWYQACVSDGNGGWTKSIRTMSAHELATTVVNYQNADCNSGAAMITTVVQTLTSDNKLVPITWTDATGKPATAPPGLENIKEANAATGLATYATATPLIQAQADALNDGKFAGIIDWRTGVTRDILPYFTAIGLMKGTVIVDDRTETGAVYDGLSVNPKEYPTLMPNTKPHKGALNGIKY